MPGKKQVHKLEDLLVEEVSIVDRPANKRPFLLVKNETGAKGAELVVDAEGNLIATELDGATETELDALVTKSEADADPGSSTVEKDLSIAPEVRRMIFQQLGQATRRLNGVLNIADAAPTDFDGDGDPSPIPPMLAKELGDIAALITSSSAALGKLKKSDETEASLEALVTSLEASVQKRGAKMSSGRLGKFKAALAALQSILAELDAGGTPVKKAEVEAITLMTSSVEKLTETVRKQAREIRVLKESRPASNVHPADAGAPVPKAPEKVVWPSDMARGL